MLKTQADHLPDGGRLLTVQKKMLETRLKQLNAPVPQVLTTAETAKIITNRQFLAQSKTLTSGAIVHLHK